ncbi:MAG: hypothetical protein M3Q65_23805 [Chloroflexota bacterium]|nr:hypothetical protein [Chloroflexota bacterium]
MAIVPPAALGLTSGVVRDEAVRRRLVALVGEVLDLTHRLRRPAAALPVRRDG